MTSQRRDTALVLVVALGLRLIYAIQHSATIYFDHPILDSLWIHQWAVSLANGGGSGEGAYFRAPLYPMVLAGLYRLFGTSQWVVVVFQHLLGAATSVLCLRIGTAVVDRRVGVVAALFWACSWTAIFFEGEILIVTLATFLGALFVERLLAACGEAPGSRARAWRLASAGLALGLASIARPNFLILVPVALLAPWCADRRDRAAGGWFGPRRGLGDHLRSMALTLGAIAIVIAPVTIRNLVVARDFVLIAAQGGLNFYVGNGPDADGKTAIAPESTGPMRRDVAEGGFRDNISLAGRAVAERDAGRPLSESEVSRYWFRRTTTHIAEDPASWFRLLGVKLYYFCNNFEIDDNKDLDEIRHLTPILGWISPLSGVVWPLALVGAVCFLLVGRYRFVTVSVLFLYCLSVVLFFVNSRLRLPVMPMVTVFAGCGVLAGVTVIRRRAWAHGAAVVAAVVATSALTQTRLFAIDEHRGRPAFRLNRAVLLIEAGRCVPALAAYRELAESHPDMTEAVFGWARALERCGDVGGALEQYELAAARWPSFPFADLARARLLADLGRRADAERAYRRAIERAPALADARLNYASFLGRTGRPREAAAEFERGLELDPGRLKSWVAYGYTLAQLGRLDEARMAFHRALSIDPGDAAALAGARSVDGG